MGESYAVTHEEAAAVARRQKNAGITRPTPAPLPWAEGLKSVGITGTNGKTSTTHMLAHLLRALERPVLEKTTLGCWIDEDEVVKSRDLRGYLEAFGELRARGGELSAVEVTSHALASGYAKFWRFDVGVFTNLSRDHLKAHGSWEHYLASKAQLFVHLPDEGAAVLNARDETALLLDQVIPPQVARFWYSAGNRAQPMHDADLAAHHLEVTAAGTLIHLAPSSTADAIGPRLKVPFVGDVYAENALAAVGAALQMGVPASMIAPQLANCSIVPGRFQIVSHKPLTVVDYAHTPESLAYLCQTARQVVKEGKIIVVFGAGGGADPEKRGPMGEAVGRGADYAFITNDNPRHEDPQSIAQSLAEGCKRGGRARTTTIMDRRAAISAALNTAGPDDIVLVAGKGHEQGQEIAGDSLPFSDAQVILEALSLTNDRGPA